MPLILFPNFKGEVTLGTPFLPDIYNRKYKIMRQYYKLNSDNVSEVFYCLFTADWVIKKYLFFFVTVIVVWYNIFCPITRSKSIVIWKSAKLEDKL